MQRLANPTRFMALANSILPYVWVIAILLLAAGLFGALVTSPPDYQQGETVRIMYIHVPAAMWAEFVYVIMAIASITAFVFRHPLADAAAKTAAPVGAVFCFLALVTGSLWGKPMWGAWWVWDARLTSMFVLMLLYIGYIAVWQAIEEPARAAMLARIVALVGVINIPIIKFSVVWWNSLHQTSSLVREGGPAMPGSMLWPLLTMIAAFGFLFFGLHLIAIKTEIASRHLRRLMITRGEHH